MNVNPDPRYFAKCKNVLFFQSSYFFFIVVIQLLSCAQLFATQWTTAHQASLSFTISQSLLKLTSMSQWCHTTASSSVAPFSFALNLSQYQDFFQWLDSSSHQVAKVFAASASVVFSEVSKHEQNHRFW